MNFVIHQLRRIRAWHFVYAIFLVLTLAGIADRHHAYWASGL
jgi:hypothetical protein